MIKKEELRLLLDLQELEINIKKLEKLIQKLIQEEVELRKQLAHVEQEEATLLLELKKLDDEIRQTNQEISICMEGIKRAEERLSKVRKAQEYKALLREKARYEDCVIKLKDQLKLLQAERKQKEQTYKNQKKNLEVKHRELKEKLEEISLESELTKGKLEQLKQERNKLINHIPEHALREYENLKSSLELPVIVPVVSFGACGGCGMKLPSSLYSKVMLGEVVICPNCARLIYYEA
ncbi:zinc ribbon domain-containing protein [Hydrogenobacter hydrogenophilus]|uniref:C4-type zinc ribbon domain-containing protein n=1 Tax=Hydrogenobacter hydrogenophilus TaxID=35835 RepID=A0A285P3E4_9AQUI|nr:C4-type zinc ribbon domain-containing protein [Hydrogenobacter hydrogenophilus]SNZ14391.1 hypothetical protein SAMN06265353_1071 [Hydrogenobacter hydrogenophilus]